MRVLTPNMPRDVGRPASPPSAEALFITPDADMELYPSGARGNMDIKERSNLERTKPEMTPLPAPPEPKASENFLKHKVRRPVSETQPEANSSSRFVQPTEPYNSAKDRLTISRWVEALRECPPDILETLKQKDDLPQKGEDVALWFKESGFPHSADPSAIARRWQNGHAEKTDKQGLLKYRPVKVCYSITKVVQAQRTVVPKASVVALTEVYSALKGGQPKKKTSKTRPFPES